MFTVCYAYRTTEAGFALSHLESAGIQVHMKSYNIHNTTPGLATAYQGIEIQVPRSSADVAHKILEAFPTWDAKPKSISFVCATILLFALGAAFPVQSGLYLASPTRQEVRNTS